jgi:hypothetical protein
MIERIGAVLIIYVDGRSRERIIATIRACGLSSSLDTHRVGLFLVVCLVP